MKYKVTIYDIQRLEGSKVVEVEATTAEEAEDKAYDLGVSGEIDFEPREILDNITTTSKAELIK